MIESPYVLFMSVHKGWVNIVAHHPPSLFFFSFFFIFSSSSSASHTLSLSRILWSEFMPRRDEEGERAVCELATGTHTTALRREERTRL